MTIEPHSNDAKITARLRAVGSALDSEYAGELVRFINPAYSKSADIVDGAGALHAAGRWNLKGAARLSYTALTPQTALAEALAHVQYYRLPVTLALPRVLVALDLNVSRAMDLREGSVRQALRISQATICQLDWRVENQTGREAITQAWGRAFAAAGFEAVIVPSAADPSGANVLVFPANLQAGSRFAVTSEVKWPAT